MTGFMKTLLTLFPSKYTIQKFRGMSVFCFPQFSYLFYSALISVLFFSLLVCVCFKFVSALKMLCISPLFSMLGNAMKQCSVNFDTQNDQDH